MMPRTWIQADFKSGVAPVAGSILVAHPFLSENNFRRSVVYLVEHDDDGALGYILNKPLEYRLPEVAVQFPYFNAPIYYGGPVKLDTLRFIHRVGHLLEGSIPIANGVFWGGQIESLKNLILENRVTPDDFRFFLGYSGWSVGQLEGELNRQSWTVAPSPANDLLTIPAENMWRDSMKSLGEPFDIMANYPIDPRLN